MIWLSKTGQRFSGACLMLLALCCAARGGNQAPVAGQAVTLGWTASSDSTVVGYYLYYGTTSGVFTGKINVGTNTEYSVSGLAAGSTYYFTITAYNAAEIESSYVPQVSYLVPGLLTLTQSLTAGLMRVQFPVAPGQSYQLQTSSNLESWSNLWLTPTQTNNTWIEYDEPLTNGVPSRYYRLILY
jgi:hypothetical protein